MGNEEFARTMDEMDDLQKEAMLKFHSDSERWWESLTKEEQISALYCVISRVNHGFKQKVSYRGILYGIFGFKHDSYSVGMECGLFDIYNKNWETRNGKAE